ncbi:MAG: hypothetical protein ACE5JS_17655 [Nitrospinota bacterium]
MRKRWLAAAAVVCCVIFALKKPLMAQNNDADEEPPQLTLERALIQRGGLLLRPGQLELEPTFDYSFFSTRRISVTGFSILPTFIVGEIATAKVQRDVLEPSLTVRLGVIQDVQAELRVPYRFVFDRVSTETSETTAQDNDIGDVEGAIFYQPFKEQGIIPDVIVGLRGKTITGQDPFGLDPARELPTGTGLYSITGTVTAVRSSDPAVIFGGLIFTHNIDRTVTLRAADGSLVRTSINPGYTIGYNVGVAMAFSIDLAFNFRLEQRFTTPTETGAPGGPKSDVPGSFLNVAQAFFGITWALTQITSIDFSTGIGLTEDSPDVTVRVSVPIRVGNLFDWIKELRASTAS